MPISSALGSSALLPAGLGFRNVLINGAMQIAQRSTSVASISANSGVYNTVDRWNLYIGTAGTWTQSQSTDAPAGFSNSLKMQCTTINGSLSAGSYAIMGQSIEGFNVQQFAKGTVSAKPMSFSFWVKAYQAGNYIVEFYDEANSRQITKTYTINSSATWEYKTIQISADTVGTFANSNASALTINFWFAAGTSYSSGTSGSWATASNPNRAAGLNVNSASSTNNYFAITGVQLEQNYQPTPFEQRPYGTELALCQRYYYRLVGNTYSRMAIAGNGSLSGGFPTMYLKQTMRTQPTFSYSALSDFSIEGLNAQGTATPTSIIYNAGNTDAMTIYCTSAGSATAGGIQLNSAATGAWIAWSAEL